MHGTLQRRLLCEKVSHVKVASPGERRTDGAGSRMLRTVVVVAVRLEGSG